MKLYIVQHGAAVAKDVDPDRPLSDIGRGDIERLGAFLSERAVNVSRIAHSGKTRARQTAEILAGALTLRMDLESVSHLGPLDSPQVFAGELEQSSGDVLVASHMPFVGKLVTLLLTNNPDLDLVDFQPGSLVCLERATPPPGRWMLQWMIRPHLLRS